MNNFQQNNTSIKFIKIEILNITFNQIRVDSNLNNLLDSLKTKFSELERSIRFKMTSEDVKRKAIEVNSVMHVLMDSIEKVDSHGRDEFSKKIIESCAAVIEEYEKAELTAALDPEVKKDLVSNCLIFFRKNLGDKIDQIFWNELKYYEWLKKENFVYEAYSNYRQEYVRYFTDEQLEQYFLSNRSDIIKKMLGEERGFDNKLIIYNPLSDERKKTAFEAYKKLPA